jgi:hypothetical protein
MGLKQDAIHEAKDIEQNCEKDDEERRERELLEQELAEQEQEKIRQKE